MSVRRPLQPRPSTRFAAAIALGLAQLAGSCGGGGAQPADSARPNLLLVVLDTTRADHLSSYGYARTTTPTIDALAERGLLCEEVWAQSSLTPVSAASFLTGTHPYRTGIRSLFMVGQQELAPDVVTLAELLGDDGYRTGAFVSAPPIGSRYELDRGFETFSDDVSRGARRRRARGLGNEHQRRADTTTDVALQWLDAAPEDGRPFALMVHFFDAHDATLVPPRAFLEDQVSFPLPADLDEREHLKEVRDPAQRIELYDAELRFMDLQVERLLDTLRERGELDHTLVVVIADHGEGLGQHDFWTHGLLWGEQLRVPWILAGPGVPNGRRLDARVRLVDLLPTLTELLDVELPGSPLDGRSILPLLGGADEEPREVYAEIAHAPGDRMGRDPNQWTLIAGPWKYVQRPKSAAPELYDLSTDPEELTDLYRPDHPVATALRAELARRGAFGGPVGGTDHLDADTVEMLRELGYL